MRLLASRSLHLVGFSILVPVALASAQRTLDSTMLTGLKLRSIGPANTSGRVDDFAVGRVAGQPDALYVATASGGIFKSTNGAVSWTAVFDNVNAMMSMGAVAVAPSMPNVVWAGTGEANNRQSSSWGDGVYKSTDAGRTWKNMGLAETQHIGRIVVDPTNPNIVFVAAQGHLWGPNPERGVFKTTDGGATWHKVLYVDENSGANDIVIDRKNPRTLFASINQRQRTSWGYNGGGPGSGIYRTTDGGDHWTRLTNGLPKVDLGRIALAMFPSDGRVVYATVEAVATPGAGAGRGGRGAAPADSAAAGGRGGRGGRAGGAGAAGGGAAAAGAAADTAAAAGGGGGGGGANAAVGEGGVYRTMDGGATWQRLANTNPRPSYYSQIRLDPKDRNRVYVLGSNRGFLYSDDGGKSFKDNGVSGVHGEDHALWVDPDDPNHLIVGGDGGVSISWDRGTTWDFRDNMPIGQFYEIDADMKIPFNVCGGLQDNGEWCVPSASRDRNGIANVEAWNIGGGDGFYVKFDRFDDNFAYRESQNGAMSRVNLKTLEVASGKPNGQGLRWNWDTPIHVSSVDPKVVYMGSNFLHKSVDRGATWTTISPDLTLHVNRDTIKMMGALVPANAASRHDGASNFSSLTSIGESPLDAKVIYTGSDDGQVQVTRDGGTTWTNVTSKVPGLPPMTYVSTVLPSQHMAGRVYATFDGHYNDDYKPYVYVSDDYGQTWRSLSAGLPVTSINRIREHPHNANVLVLAHERGVHISTDAGRSWVSLSLATNFPTVPTDDALIHPRDNSLVLGTHGRGIWVLDDIGIFEALTPEALAADATLAPIAPARVLVTHSPQAWFGSGIFFAPNPAPGSVIAYYLRDGAAAGTQIEILDATGKHVRTLEGQSTKGVNRVTWDLRGDPGAGGAGGGGRGGGGRGGGGGAAVAPGTYTVVLKVPGITRDIRRTMTVEKDPLSIVSR